MGSRVHASGRGVFLFSKRNKYSLYRRGKIHGRRSSGSLKTSTSSFSGLLEQLFSWFLRVPCIPRVRSVLFFLHSFPEICFMKELSGALSRTMEDNGNNRRGMKRVVAHERMGNVRGGG